jgi:tetratricopeptide (TPR) repeat protein
MTKRRCAQLNDSLAHLHLTAGRLELAEQAVGKAVKTLETGGMEAYLAESLTTQGLVLCRLGRHREAKRVLERAYSVAERCGHREGAAHALLMEIEEMCEHLQDEERLELGARLDQLLASSKQASTLDRLGKCHDLIAAAHASDQ